MPAHNQKVKGLDMQQVGTTSEIQLVWGGIWFMSLLRVIVKEEWACKWLWKSPDGHGRLFTPWNYVYVYAYMYMYMFIHSFICMFKNLYTACILHMHIDTYACSYATYIIYT